jgi:hypothetical protein
MTVRVKSVRCRLTVRIDKDSAWKLFKGGQPVGSLMRHVFWLNRDRHVLHNLICLPCRKSTYGVIENRLLLTDEFLRDACSVR